jgi:cyclopropane fatty-acyl-phospholipid synthase-like methyltransferase
VQANVLELERLPSSWGNYDLIVSASMLEYVDCDRFIAALSGLRALLNENGTFVLFITRKNWVMQQLTGRWWQSTIYSAVELQGSFLRTGFSPIQFRTFPSAFSHLDLWGFIIEAQILA